MSLSTWQAQSSQRRDYFWSLDRMGRSEVLANSRNSSIQLAAVSGPVVDRRRRRRRDTFLALVMEIYPAPSYLVY